ncbi:MAG: hypothetical protein WC862_00110 [Patescibacteria group bacterium]
MKRRIRQKAKRAAKSKIKKDIAHAVESIPGFILEEAVFRQERPSDQAAPPSKAENQKRGRQTYYQPPKQGRGLMWFGVIALAAAIFIMWSWNVKTMINDFSQKNIKSEILGSAGEDLGSIFSRLSQQSKEAIAENAEGVKQEIKKENGVPEQPRQITAEEAIRETLAGLFGAVTSTATSTSTSTSTENTTTEF